MKSKLEKIQELAINRNYTSAEKLEGIQRILKEDEIKTILHDNFQDCEVEDAGVNNDGNRVFYVDDKDSRIVMTCRGDDEWIVDQYLVANNIGLEIQNNDDRWYATPKSAFDVFKEQFGEY